MVEWEPIRIELRPPLLVVDYYLHYKYTFLYKPFIHPEKPNGVIMGGQHGRNSAKPYWINSPVGLF
jgi:hypothetical protein